MHLPASTRGANKHSTRAAHRLQHMHPFNLARQRGAVTSSHREPAQKHPGAFADNRPPTAIKPNAQASSTNLRRRGVFKKTSSAALRKEGHFSRTSNAATRLPQRKRAAHVLRL